MMVLLFKINSWILVLFSYISIFLGKQVGIGMTHLITKSCLEFI